MDILGENIAQRLGGNTFGKKTEVYKFEKIKRAKKTALKEHPDVRLIDMGVGEPDKPADPGIVNILAQEAGRPENRWYSDNGIPEFQEAAADYLETIYQVKNLDPFDNIIHSIGSKPALAMFPLCLINPSDITLTTTPGYPVIATYTKYLGGEVYSLPLLQENSFFPDFSRIPQSVLKRSKLLYINYPNNPTGQVATREFFAEVVKFAYKHNIVIISDAAYGAITFDGYEPLSFLSVDGAMDVGVEIHSLSKAFNMTGWRLAFVAGNPTLVKAYGTIKDNTDSGQFRAIQKAGIYALRHPELTHQNCERYSRRFDLLISALREVGFAAEKPKGTFYCYVRCPRGTRSGISFKNAEAVSEFLIREALISTVPWDDAGSYLRFSVTFEADGYEQEKGIIKEIQERLEKLELVF